MNLILANMPAFGSLILDNRTGYNHFMKPLKIGERTVFRSPGRPADHITAGSGLYSCKAINIYFAFALIFIGTQQGDQAGSWYLLL